MRPFAAIVFTVVLTALLLSPEATRVQASSSSRIIAQKSAKKGSFEVYLAHPLVSGHSYRVEILSAKGAAITAQGFMSYTYVVNHSLAQGMKPVTLQGSAPYSYTVSPPTSTRLSQWLLVVDARVTGKHPLTVRYRDLGK